MPARVTEVKCRRCSKVLFTEECTPLLTAHGEVRTAEPHFRCGTGIPEYFLYISIENMPEWMTNIVTKEYWTKGRIHCPKCNSRIGSFNFINRTKCDCGNFMPPPIRITHYKVDRLFDQNNQPIPHIPRGFRLPERQHAAPALVPENDILDSSNEEH